MISVLFVCLGNICRSPMAEALFRHYVKEAGLDEQLQIDSAGTGDWHVGEEPHTGTKSKLDELGISYHGMRARQVTMQDLSRFDYIIAMDDKHLRTLQAMSHQKMNHLYRFVDLIPETTYQEVPDPYYTGDFAETYELVREGCQALLEKICEEHRIYID